MGTIILIDTRENYRNHKTFRRYSQAFKSRVLTPKKLLKVAVQVSSMSLTVGPLVQLFTKTCIIS